MSLHALASHRLTVVSLLLCLGSVVACYSDKPGTVPGKSAQAPGTSGLELQPIPATHDTALREVDNFALNQDVIDRWSVAKRGMDSTTLANPDIVKRLRAEGPPSGIGEMGKRIDDEPKLASVMKSAHIDGHTFMLTTIALQQAIHGFQLKQTGKLAKLQVPPVIMQNIDYVSGHMPQIMSAMHASQKNPPAVPR
ncbi:MAG: hypothetical protein ABI446_11235 [Gemmatimonadaceae bacterium]